MAKSSYHMQCPWWPLASIRLWFKWENCCIFVVQRGITAPLVQLWALDPPQEPLAIWSQQWFISCIIRNDQKCVWKGRTPLCAHSCPARLGFNLSSKVKAAGFPAQLTSYDDIGGFLCRISDIVIGDAAVGASILRRDGGYGQCSAVEDRLLGQAAGRPHPRQAGGWLPSCRHTDQGDSFSRVHHYWVIHQELNRRGCCKTQGEEEGVAERCPCCCSVLPSTLSPTELLANPMGRLVPHLSASVPLLLTLPCTLLCRHLLSLAVKQQVGIFVKDNPVAVLGKECMLYGTNASTPDFQPWKKSIRKNFLWHRKRVALFKSDPPHWKQALLILLPLWQTAWDLAENREVSVVWAVSAESRGPTSVGTTS